MSNNDKKLNYYESRNQGAQDIFNRYAGGSNAGGNTQNIPNNSYTYQGNTGVQRDTYNQYRDQSNQNSARVPDSIPRDAQNAVGQAPRPQYNKIYTNNSSSPVKTSIRKVQNQSRCPVPLLAIIGLLAVAAIVLGILFGLGVIGPKGHPIEEAGKRDIMVEGVMYNPDVVIIQEETVRAKNTTPTNQFTATNQSLPADIANTTSEIISYIIDNQTIKQTKAIQNVEKVITNTTATTTNAIQNVEKVITNTNATTTNTTTPPKHQDMTIHKTYVELQGSGSNLVHLQTAGAPDTSTSHKSLKSQQQHQEYAKLLGQ